MSPSAHATYHFDASSGLSWSERTVKTQRRRYHTFRRPSSSSASSTQPSTGTPTLEELATRTLLRYLDLVTIDTLDGLPLHLGKHLWNRIERSNLTTPTLFASFCAAFPHDPTFAYYTAADIVPQNPFQDYLSLLSSPPLHWLTALTLSDISLSRPDLLRLSSDLPNLVALDIASTHDAPGPHVDDRILRDWALHALASPCRAFSHLRVLILRGQPHVTLRALEHLAAFPSLALFGVVGCGLNAGDEGAALRLGWAVGDVEVDGIGKGGGAGEDGSVLSRGWDGAMRGWVQRGGELWGERRKREREEHLRLRVSEEADHAPSTPPLLNFRLGRMSSDSYGAPSSSSSSSSSSSPLVFFRNVACTSTSSEPGEQSEPRPREPADANAAGVSGTGQTKSPSTSTSTARPTSKKRKIKAGAGRDVAELLEAFGA